MPDSHSVYNVFTPGTQARVNFVERPAVNDRLVQALRTPGTQLIVYGESGSGKSTLVQAKLRELYEDHITSRCTSGTTFSSLLLDAFDKLAPFYLDESAASEGNSSTSTLAADFKSIHATIQASSTRGRSSQSRRALPPQLTAQRLAEFLGERHFCWVIEDFHKVPDNEKTALSQTFKVFSDTAADYESVKIIAIGATESPREVVDYDREVRNRVTEILVPLMNADELGQIISNGQRLLNVDLSALKDNVVLYAVGVPAVAHQIALNVCVSRGIQTTQTETYTFESDEFENAVKLWLEDSSDTLKATFDRALMRHRVRQFDNCRLILTALADGPLTGMLHAEILEKIREVERSYPPANLTLYLAQLTDEERGDILLKSPDGRFRFTDPLHHTYAKALLLKPAAPMSDRSTIYADWVSMIGTTVKAFNIETKWVDKKLSPSVYYMSEDVLVDFVNVPEKPQILLPPPQRHRPDDGS